MATALVSNADLEETLRAQVKQRNRGRRHRKGKMYYDPELELVERTERSGRVGLEFELQWWQDEDCGSMLHKITSSFFNSDEHNPNNFRAAKIVLELIVGQARLIVYNVTQ